MTPAETAELRRIGFDGYIEGLQFALEQIDRRDAADIIREEIKSARRCRE